MSCDDSELTAQQIPAGDGHQDMLEALKSVKIVSDGDAPENRGRATRNLPSQHPTPETSQASNLPSRAPTSEPPKPASDPHSQKPDQEKEKKKKMKRKDSKKAPVLSDQLITSDEQAKEPDWGNPKVAQVSEGPLPLFRVPTTKEVPREESAKLLERSQRKTEAVVDVSTKKKQNRPKKKGGPIEEKSVKIVSDHEPFKNRISTTQASESSKLISDPPSQKPDQKKERKKKMKR